MNEMRGKNSTSIAWGLIHQRKIFVANCLPFIYVVNVEGKKC